MQLGDNAPSAAADSLRVNEPVTLSRRVAARLLVAAAYLAVSAGTTGIGPVQAIIAALAIATGLCASDHRRQLVDAALPFLLFAAIYHGLGHWALAVAARGVHVFIPYWLDKS